MAPAGRLAGPDNAVPSLPGSDSWLRKKRNKKKSPELFQVLHVLVEVKLHFRCCQNILDLVVNKQLTRASPVAAVECRARRLVV